MLGGAAYFSKAMFTNRYPIIVMYAIALHALQGFALMASPLVSGVTSISAVEHFLGRAAFLTPYVFLAVAALAATGIIIGQRTPTILCMLPQQFLLFISAYGSLACIINGRFADGTVRLPTFLMADQSPTVLAALGHTVAVVALFEKRTWARR